MTAVLLRFTARVKIGKHEYAPGEQVELGRNLGQSLLSLGVAKLVDRAPVDKMVRSSEAVTK